MPSPKSNTVEKNAPIHRRTQEPAFTYPSGTMLPLEVLNRMDDISGPALYSAETKRLPHIAKPDQQPIIDAARKGDKDARDALIVNCLNWTMARAARMYKALRPAHLDVMDVVGVGNVELMERLDKALTLEDPIAYLLTCVSLEMQSYCANKNPLIQRPRMNNERRTHLDPVPATSVSLERPFEKGGTRSYADVLPAADQPLISDEEHERHHDRRFAVLHDAVRQLSPHRRNAIIHSYGFFGETAKTKEDIAQQEQRTKASISHFIYHGRKDLEKTLEPYLTKRGLRRPNEQP